MLVVVLDMPEHSSFQDMLFPMLFISKYAKSYASIMDISLPSGSVLGMKLTTASVKAAKLTMNTEVH